MFQLKKNTEKICKVLNCENILFEDILCKEHSIEKNIQDLCISEKCKNNRDELYNYCKNCKNKMNELENQLNNYENKMRSIVTHLNKKYKRDYQIELYLS